jgi:hypothetical protein
MAALVPYLLVLWIPLTLVVYPLLPRGRALVILFLVGLLFLPEPGISLVADAVPRTIKFPGMHFTKLNVLSYAAVLAILVYTPKQLLAFRPRWFDLPMLVWCLCPLVSALTNDPPPDGSSSLYEGLSQGLQAIVTWGVPYFVGRLYLTDFSSLHDAVLLVVFAAAAYTPLCLLEVRLSPQLHRWIYGYYQHQFAQTVRLGGFRPIVFMQHGLVLSMFLTSALLFVIWLWLTEYRFRSAATIRLRTPVLWSLGLILVTEVLAKSSGAMLLAFAGLSTLLLTVQLRSRVVVLLLIGLIPLYVTLRITGGYSGEQAIELAKETLGPERAQSLQFRLENENQLIKRALEQPVFGWGGWGRSRVHDERTGKDTSVTDGLWIIALGLTGFAGLFALGAVLLLPVLRFIVLCPPALWAKAGCSAAAAVAVVMTLVTIDWLGNGGMNPIYLLLVGGLSGLPAPGAQVLPARRHIRATGPLS